MTQHQTNFVSLGGVWLDEIRWPNQPARKDVVGGSATYATLGARLFESAHPSLLALIVNAGYDFPQDVIHELKRWQVRIEVLSDRDKQSTRGILEHNGSAGSKFTRLTPPLLTSPADLATAGALGSQLFHMFAVPDLVQSQCLQIEGLRRKSGTSTGKPIVIWEPHPKSCTMPLLKEHIALLHDNAITVFSPNHHELNAFFEEKTSETRDFEHDTIEARARSLFGPPKFVYDATRQTGPGVQVIIIRAAENGCLVLQRNQSKAVWLPALYSAEEQHKVIDPTGAGNAFLGGLAQGWLETGDWLLAACYGTVAASIVIEHVGPPSLDTSTETWGGVDARQRLAAYRSRSDVDSTLGWPVTTRW